MRKIVKDPVPVEDWSNIRTIHHRFQEFKPRKTKGSMDTCIFLKLTNDDSVLMGFTNNIFVAGYHTGNRIYPVATTQCSKEKIKSIMNRKNIKVYSNTGIAGSTYLNMSIIDAYKFGCAK